MILEWPEFLKDRALDEPGAACLFHILEDYCQVKLRTDKLVINDTACAARVVTLPQMSPLTRLNRAMLSPNLPQLGAADPLPPVALTPWRLQPSQAEGSVAPRSRNIRLGDPWPVSPNTTARGNALHLALRTHLIRPDLAGRLPAATGLDHDTLLRTAQRAAALQDWLGQRGLNDLRCEVPFLRHKPDGSEIAGMIDLVAFGKKGAMLVDHKTGGDGEGMGPYWSQLEAYAALMPSLFPDHRLLGVIIHWVDHGALELVELQEVEWDYSTMSG